MWYGIRSSVQPKLVRPFLRVPPSLADVGDHEKEVHRKDGSKRAVHPRPPRVMRPIVNGDLRHINEPVDLCLWKLARNTVAHLLRSHTFWLPAT